MTAEKWNIFIYINIGICVITRGLRISQEIVQNSLKVLSITFLVFSPNLELTKKKYRPRLKF
jgi:hypothetical protein